MKNNRLLPFTALGLWCMTCFTQCKKDTLAPTTTLNEQTDSTATLIREGVFTDGPYGTVTGKAALLKKYNPYLIQLSNFTSSNGPALHVYLSKEAMPINFIDAGALKSTSGNQVYPLTTATALSVTEYAYISVHCVDYNHLFGYAPLK